MLFLEGQAEWEANAPLRESMAIKRERLRALRAKRAAKQRQRLLSPEQYEIVEEPENRCRPLFRGDAPKQAPAKIQNGH